MTGHLSSCTKFKVKGEMIVSGAVDTNIKMWDSRMKQCINTFKGHMDAITCLDISPDNRIVVSGS
jgi:katanin p80 WD40 repeat-containing subunit B1